MALQRRTGTPHRARVNSVARASRGVSELVLLAVTLSLSFPIAQTQATVAGRQPVWVNTYDGPARGGDAAEAMVASPDGSMVYVTGSSDEDDSYNPDDDYATVAYEVATGLQVWSQRYDGPESLDDEATAIAVSPDGTKVFVTGRSFADYSGSLDDYATIAYDAATGAELWVERYEGLDVGYDDANAIVADPDGTTVYVTGISDADFATIAYQADTGTEVWVARYSGPGESSNRANAVAVNAAGTRVYVTGNISGTHPWDYGTVAYDAGTGEMLWVQSYDGVGTFEDTANDVAVSPDGTKVFVTGQSYGGGTPDGSLMDYATVAYDAETGQQLWVKRYNGRPKKDDFAYALAVSPDSGTVYVTGKAGEDTWSGPLGDAVTIAYDATTGRPAWLQRYHSQSGRSDGAVAIAASPDGSRVYAVGKTGLYNGDYLIIAYAPPTGRQVWVRRLHGTGRMGQGPDSGQDVALSPDGSTLFVTGWAWMSDSQDYMTAAFATS